MRETRVVAAVLVRGDTVLVAQRAAHKREGLLWELPGGKVEPGESDADALVRELSEELGARVEVVGELGENVFGYAHSTVRLVALHCVLVQGEPAAIEHAAIRWVTVDELDALDWAPADVGLLPPVRALLRGRVGT